MGKIFISVVFLIAAIIVALDIGFGIEFWSMFICANVWLSAVRVKL